jgi:hypothetical protein
MVMERKIEVFGDTLIICQKLEKLRHLLVSKGEISGSRRVVPILWHTTMPHKLNQLPVYISYDYATYPTSFSLRQLTTNRVWPHPHFSRAYLNFHVTSM